MTERLLGSHLVLLVINADYTGAFLCQESPLASPRDRRRGAMTDLKGQRLLQVSFHPCPEVQQLEDLTFSIRIGARPTHARQRATGLGLGEDLIAQEVT